MPDPPFAPICRHCGHTQDQSDHGNECNASERRHLASWGMEFPFLPTLSRGRWRNLASVAFSPRNVRFQGRKSEVHSPCLLLSAGCHPPSAHCLLCFLPAATCPGIPSPGPAPRNQKRHRDLRPKDPDGASLFFHLSTSCRRATTATAVDEEMEPPWVNLSSLPGSLLLPVFTMPPLSTVKTFSAENGLTAPNLVDLFLFGLQKHSPERWR